MKLKEIIEIQKDRNHVFSNIWNPESSNRWGGGEESDGGRRQCSGRVYEEARTKRMAFPANLKKAMKVEGGFFLRGEGPNRGGRRRGLGVKMFKAQRDPLSYSSNIL